MRRATINRQTNETEVTASVDLDGCGRYDVSTGVGFLDHMLEQLSRHSLIDLTLAAKGDLHIDAHHTTEDSGIVLGQALAQALGDRRGIRRFGQALSAMDEALTRVVIDASNRPLPRLERAVLADAAGRPRYRADRPLVLLRRSARRADPARRDALRHQQPPHLRSPASRALPGRCARRSRSIRARPTRCPRPRACSGARCEERPGILRPRPAGRLACASSPSTCAGRRAIPTATSSWSRKGSAGRPSPSRWCGRCGAGCGWWRWACSPWRSSSTGRSPCSPPTSGRVWRCPSGLMVVVGLVGNDLKRWTLFRRGYLQVGVVTGADRDAAEQRFWDQRPLSPRTSVR